MLIAIDFDQTYTVDPEFWDIVIMAAKQKGHRIICATMRYEHEGYDVLETIGKNVEKVIFTDRNAKMAFVKNQGYEPDVWIDDSPHWLFQGG